MKTRRWLDRFAVVVCFCLLCSPAAAQSDDIRQAGSTFLGDTGLWFVPTAEIVGDGRVAASGHLATFNREQGFTAVQSAAATFAVGLRDRVEVFGSFQFLTRIDRDLRPIFQPDKIGVGGLVPGYPLVTSPFSGNEIGDFIVGAKINLLSERTRAPYAMAIRGFVKLPSGSEEAGTTTGQTDGGIGFVMSKAFARAELAGHFDFVFRANPSTIDLPNSLRWGVGVGAPVRGRVQFFGELLGEQLLSSAITVTDPLIGADGSLSTLGSLQRSPLDVILGLEWNGPSGVALGGGMSVATRHKSRSVVDQSTTSGDRFGLLVRLTYHPGVNVYVPPPPPPPPAPPPPPPPPPPRQPPPPPAPPAPAPDPPREYVFEDVHFDFDRYSLRPGAARVLDEVVAALQDDSDLTIEIEGHTCNIGTNEYNVALGDRRANAVQQYLTSRGVGGNRLRTVSYGEERPVHDNAREETRRLNRRAALVVRLQ